MTQRNLSVNVALFALIAVVAGAVTLLPGAAYSQTGTLFVEGNNVGVGIAAPASKLHVVGDGNAQLQVQDTSAVTAERVLYRLLNKGKVRFAVNNTNLGVEWTFDNDGNFNISKVGTGVNEFLVDGNGNVFAQGTFNTVSSRESKKEIVPVDAEKILEKVMGLPLAQWTYQTEDPTVRHLGPMAEDFHAAFGLGHDDKRISVLDGTGVALAAIQGLHHEIRQRDETIAALEERLARLESLLGETPGVE